MWKSFIKIMPIIILVVVLDGLGWLLLSGNYTSFLHPRFGVFLFIGVLIIAGFFISFIIGGNPFSHCGLGDNAVRSLILITPIIFMYTVAGQDMGSHALNMKMMDSYRNVIKGNTVTKDASTSDGKSYKEMSILDIAMDIGKLNGQGVITHGHINKDSDLPEGYAVLYRFGLYCCAADAFPVWLIFKSTKLASFENEIWITVKGTVKLFTVNGKDIPVIMTDEVKEEKPPPPGERYLYF